MGNMSSTKWNVVWNTGSQLVGKAVGSIAMLLVSVLIAREFGAEGFGDFTKITTFVAFFYLLVDFGLNAVFLRKAHEPNKLEANRTNNSLWGVLVGMRVAGGIFLIVLAIAVLAFLPQGSDQGYTTLVRLGIILFSPTILIQGLIVSANAVFQKHLRYDLATLALLAGNAVSVILVLVSVYGLSTQIGVLGVTTSLLLGLGVTGAVSVLFVRRIEKSRWISFDWQYVKPLFFAALPLGITLLFNQIYFRVDNVVLALTRPTVEVGLYGLAYKLFELPLVLPTFFMNSLYPLLLRSIDGEFRMKNYELREIIKKSCIALILTSLFFILIIWFAAPLLAVIRPEFAGSIPLLKILTLGLPFFFLSSLMMWSLIALGKQIVLAGIYGSLMIFTVGLDILIIPMYGAIGAAWITVGSEGVILLVSGWILIRHIRHIGHMSHM